MPLYSQGEEYEENSSSPRPRARSRRPKETAEVEDEVEDAVEEEEEAPKKRKGKKPSNDSGGGGSEVNPKLIACIVGLVVLVILAGALFFFIQGTKDKRQDVEQSKEAESWEEYNETVTPIGVDTPLGGDEAPLGGSSDAPLGGSGDSAPLGSGDQPMGGDADTSSTSGGVGNFNGKTADTLRKWGFTNSQMEIASRDGISAEAMVEQAKLERKEAQWEAMMEAADGASEAYQRLLSQTWLGQPPMDISGFSSTNVMYATENYTENVDYEKVEASGMQLWIKCYLKNGVTAFMACPPARYNELEDSGNIVVTYTVVVAGDSRVITQINEYKVGN